MDAILTYVCEHPDMAHFVIFGLILFTGINVPISEDFLLLAAGFVASVCMPEKALSFYVWIYAACLFAGWEAYWIGRLAGPKLFSIAFFRRILINERMERLSKYYKKYGLLTFIVGRFIPGGVRNALFMSSGLLKMPFHVFMMRDFIGCLIASATIYYIGYTCGDNYDIIVYYLKRYEQFVVGLVLLAVCAVGIIVAVARLRPIKEAGNNNFD